jgi:hypothetical protein
MAEQSQCDVTLVGDLGGNWFRSLEIVGEKKRDFDVVVIVVV